MRSAYTDGKRSEANKQSAKREVSKANEPSHTGEVREADKPCGIQNRR